MSGLFGDLWDGLKGGFLRKPLKKATGMSDAQLAGATALAIAAPYALSSVGAGAGSAASGGMGGFFEGLMGASGSAGSAGSAGAAGAESTFAQGLGTAGKVATIGQQTGLLGAQPQAPMQAPQLPQFQDVSGGLLSGLDEMQRKRMARRGLLGDGYGAA